MIRMEPRMKMEIQGRVPRTHWLKTRMPYFKAVKDGLKDFEVRRDDRGFDVGDILVLQEYDPMLDARSGLEVVKRVKYLLRDAEFCKAGYVVMGLEDVSPLERVTS